MIGEIVVRALPGLTVIEDGSGAVGRLLMEQVAKTAEESGFRIIRMPLDGTEETFADELYGFVKADASAQRATQMLKRELVLVDGFSTSAFGLPETEMVKIVKRMKAASSWGRSFMLDTDGTSLGARLTAFLHGMADTVIVLRTELVGEKVARTLYLQKVRGALPTEKLLKFTVDEEGVQIDTRELIG